MIEKDGISAKMLKFFIGLSVVAFGSLCGYLCSKKYRQRKLFLSQWKEFTERFLSEIAYYRRPIREFIAAYAYQVEFEDFLRKLPAENEGNAQGNRAFIINENYSFLTKEDKRLLEDYFLMLGRGDSLSQKAYFSAVRENVVKSYSEAETQCKRYGDLYIKLGFLCGLLILLLII